MYRLLRRWWLVVWVGLSAPAVPFAAESRPQTLPWGEPDLQGTWTNATITGLERWEGFEQLALTEAAAREVETREAGLSRQIDTFAEGDLPANIMVGGYNSAWLDAGDRVLRVNGEPRTSIINDPASGKVPYSLRGWLTMWWYLIRSQKRNNPEEQLVGDRCVVGFGSTGGPPMLPVLYNNNYRIVQTEGRVNILVEMNHAVRSIRIGGSHLPPQIRPWLGDSVGRWEGDTLVVETVQMHPQQGLSTAIKQKLFLGPDTVVTERFTRTAPEEIHYAFRVEDDRMFRRPWGGELVFRPSRGEIYEYACHEGNYGMTNMLAGERSHGVNGPGWLWRLVTRTPEEFTHPQLSGSRFAQ